MGVIERARDGRIECAMYQVAPPATPEAVGHLLRCPLWHAGGVEALRPRERPCGNRRPHRMHPWVASAALPAAVEGGGERETTATVETVQCWGMPAVVAEFADAGEVTAVRCMGDGTEVCRRLLVFDRGADAECMPVDFRGWAIKRWEPGGFAGEQAWRCLEHRG